ncbi:MAG TPA: hypothetical protein VFK54_07600 [Candidatus Limnocylindrales bacterium]|nr:hypothetical protein [Candidatus Limnocylindrales bacterium]
MSASLPIATLVVIGVVITFLGLFAAGDILFVGLGVATVVAAGVLAVVADRASRSRP